MLEVDAALERLSTLAGAGSQAARREALAALFGRATETEQTFLRGLLTGELRQGALDGVVLDALAPALDLPATAVRRAAMLLGSTAAVAGLARREGADGLATVRLQVGRPVRPMLAGTAPDVARRWPRSRPAGDPAVVDTKLDGIRLQVHKQATTCSSSPAASTTSPPGCPRWWSRCARCRPGAWCSTARPSRCAPTAGRSRSR